MYRLRYLNFATDAPSWWPKDLRRWEAYYIGLALEQRGRHPEIIDASTGQPVVLVGPQ